MKRKRTSRKKIAALLAAACMAGNMPDAQASIYASENILTEETGTETSGQEDEMTGGTVDGTADKENADEESVADGTRNDTDAADAGSADESGDDDTSAGHPDSAETGGISMDGTETGAADGVQEDTADSSEAGGTDEEDADGVAADSMETSAEDSAETDTGSGISAEDAEEGSEAGGTDAVQESAQADENGSEAAGEDEDTGGTADSGTYTDENGVSYHYNVGKDGTADIYDIKDYSGKYIDIPAEMDGYAVTRLTCHMQFGNIEGLTVPETVIYVGARAFANLEIGTLRYNAQSASTADNTDPSPFSCSKIGNLLVGGNVDVIPKSMFSSAIFQQDELVIHTPAICEDAFWSAEFQKLTIGEEVRDIGVHAFSFSDVGELRWNAADIETYGEEGVGRNAPFAYASVHGISIGDAAASIPANFINGVTEFSVSSLDIPSTVTSIGSRAFYNPYEGSYTVGRLYIGENVTYLGDSVFDGCDIGVLAYNAADAATDGPDGNGPFNGSHAGELCIGEDVTVLPAKIFCGMALEQEELEISGGIVSVEDKALCSGSGNAIRIGTLTVGEHVAHMGMYALAVSSIGALNYNAEDAGTNGDQGTSDSPFYNTAVGELQIGAGVRKIPASAFAGIGLEQDFLEFPEGVASIGARAFQKSSWRDISIGTVVIGENVSFIGRGAFASCAIGRAHICTLESDWASRDMEFYGYETPACAAVEIHGGSDYYSYFTSKSNPENTTLLCSDFESSRGEEYFDSEKGCFVTPVTENCTVCGYQKLGGEYADAHTVIFVDHDGTEISRQAVHDGGDAAAPEDPERTGWRFTGWDKEYTGVTAELTVTAQYEICRFTVTFMDGETVLNSQEVEYGSDAKIPEQPSRPDEEWGKWGFSGWNGNCAGITQDEIVYAQFIKILNEYEVIFHDADGKALSAQTVTHGGIAVLPEAPAKKATAQYTYSFSGWDGDTENITADSSYHPVYEARIRTYKVTFMNGGTVLDTQDVEYGKPASAPETPVKEADGEYTYKFAGWDSEYSFITEDLTVSAVFDAEETGSGTDQGGSGTDENDKDKNESGEGTDDKDKNESGDGDDKDKNESGESTDDKDKNESGNGDDKDKNESDGSTDDKDKNESGDGDDKDKNESGEGTDDKDKDESGDDKDKNESGDSTDDKDKNESGDGNDKDKNESDSGTNETDKNESGEGDGKDKNESGDSTGEKDKNESGDGDNKDKNESGSGIDDKDKNESGDGDNKDKNESGEGTDDKDKNESGSANDKDRNESDGSGSETDKGGAENGTDKDKPGSDKDKDKNESGGSTDEKDKGRDESGSGTDKDKNESGNDEDKNKDGNGSGKDKNESGNGADKDRNESGSETDRDKNGSENSAGTDKNESGTGRHSGGKGLRNSTGSKAGTKTAGRQNPEFIPQQLPMPIAADTEKTAEETLENGTDGDAGMDDNESGQETVEDGMEEKANMTGRRWIFLIPGVAAFGILCAWLYLNFCRKKKISGVVRSAAGEGMDGMKVKLDGNTPVETCTDSSGHFCLDMPGKCRCRLSVSDGSCTILSMDIFMGEKEAEEIFRIRKSHCSHVEPKKEKNGYTVDVTV